MWRVDDCFIHGCIFCYWMCRLDVSIGCVSHFFQNVPFPPFLRFFFNHSFWPCRFGFLTFPCLWEIGISGQMISGIVSWLSGLDRIFK